MNLNFAFRTAAHERRDNVSLSDNLIFHLITLPSILYCFAQSQSRKRVHLGFTFLQQFIRTFPFFLKETVK